MAPSRKRPLAGSAPSQQSGTTNTSISSGSSNLRSQNSSSLQRQRSRKSSRQFSQSSNSRESDVYDEDRPKSDLELMKDVVMRIREDPDFAKSIYADCPRLQYKLKQRPDLRPIFEDPKFVRINFEQVYRDAGGKLPEDEEAEKNKPRYMKWFQKISKIIEIIKESTIYKVYKYLMMIKKLVSFVMGGGISMIRGFFSSLFCTSPPLDAVDLENQANPNGGGDGGGDSPDNNEAEVTNPTNEANKQALNQVADRMEQPEVQEQMNDLLQNEDPEALQTAIENDPELKALRDSNPLCAQIMSDPSSMKILVDPENLRALGDCPNLIEQDFADPNWSPPAFDPSSVSADPTGGMGTDVGTGGGGTGFMDQATSGSTPGLPQSDDYGFQGFDQDNNGMFDLDEQMELDDDGDGDYFDDDGDDGDGDYDDDGDYEDDDEYDEDGDEGGDDDDYDDDEEEEEEEEDADGDGVPDDEEDADGDGVPDEEEEEDPEFEMGEKEDDNNRNNLSDKKKAQQQTKQQKNKDGQQEQEGGFFSQLKSGVGNYVAATIADQTKSFLGLDGMSASDVAGVTLSDVGVTGEDGIIAPSSDSNMSQFASNVGGVFGQASAAVGQANDIVAFINEGDGGFVDELGEQTEILIDEQDSTDRGASAAMGTGSGSLASTDVVAAGNSSRTPGSFASGFGNSGGSGGAASVAGGAVATAIIMTPSGNTAAGPDALSRQRSLATIEERNVGIAQSSRRSLLTDEGTGFSSVAMGDDVEEETKTRFGWLGNIASSLASATKESIVTNLLGDDLGELVLDQLEEGEDEEEADEPNADEVDERQQSRHHQDEETGQADSVVTASSQADRVVSQGDERANSRSLSSSKSKSSIWSAISRS